MVKQTPYKNIPSNSHYTIFFATDFKDSLVTLLLNSLEDALDAFDIAVLDQWGVLHNGSLSFPETSSEGKGPADERESSKVIRHEGALQLFERDRKTLILDLGTYRLRRMQQEKLVATVTQHAACTDGVNRQPSELKRPHPVPAIPSGVASASYDPGTSDSESCGSNRSTR